MRYSHLGFNELVLSVEDVYVPGLRTSLFAQRFLPKFYALSLLLDTMR